MQLHNNPIDYLQQVISNGGPEAPEYETLHRVFEAITADFKAGKITAEELEALQSSFGVDATDSSILGHVRTKPFGYAGDFLIIDKIYREHTSADARYEKWDNFWHNQPACKAVRNRKDYFIRTITRALHQHRQLQLLNIASGPARDLAEVYAAIDPQRLHTTCVDADLHAISYAKELNEPYAAQVEFVHRNALRYTPARPYDIVWSAGLFDYFDDGLFVRLLRRFMQWTRPGGEVIIGNFSDQNPTQHFMELVGEWFLHHRSEAALIDIALRAGAPRNAIHVGRETEGVNLFLHVRTPLA